MGSARKFAPIYLKAWLKRRKITQERFAEQFDDLDLGLSSASVSRIGNGKQPYNCEQLAAIAKALSLSPDELLREPPSGPQEELARYCRTLNGAQASRALRILRTVLEEAAE